MLRTNRVKLAFSERKNIRFVTALESLTQIKEHILLLACTHICELLSNIRTMVERVYDDNEAGYTGSLPRSLYHMVPLYVV